MTENAAAKSPKSLLEAIERILAARFELIKLRFGLALVGITVAFRG
jgi:hypothetical protein